MFKTFSDKIIFLLFCLIVAPMIILGYFESKGILTLNSNVTSIVSDTNKKLLIQSNDSLNKLGEKIIKQTAVYTAREIEIYLKFNPKLSSEDLKKDAYFRQIAIQPVGDTGYTAITDSDSLFNFLHKQPQTEGSDLSSLSEKLPDFWNIMFKTKGGRASYGYYDWSDPDGSIRQKFMYIEPVMVKTADGKSLSVAATTYMDEFSRPAQDMQKIIEVGLNELTISINQMANNILLRSVGTILFLIFITLLLGYFFVRQISDPLKKLTNAVKESGEKDVSSSFDITSNDELGVLANTFKEMFTEIKKSKSRLEDYNAALEKEVKKKTKELEVANIGLEDGVKKRTAELERLKKDQELIIKKRTEELNLKIAELEKLNKFMINRESRMIELKKENEKLKKTPSDN